MSGLVASLLSTWEDKVGSYSLQVPSVGDGEGASPPASALPLESDQCHRLVPWGGAQREMEKIYPHLAKSNTSLVPMVGFAEDTSGWVWGCGSASCLKRNLLVGWALQPSSLSWAATPCTRPKWLVDSRFGSSALQDPLKLGRKRQDLWPCCFRNSNNNPGHDIS